MQEKAMSDMKNQHEQAVHLDCRREEEALSKFPSEAGVEPAAWNDEDEVGGGADNV